MKTLNELHRLEVELSNTQLLQADKEWGGADVVISSNPPKRKEESFYPDPRYVVTKHALELSWLFERLRDAFYAENRLDSCSKIEFFGRLANAANKTLRGSTNLTAHQLCTDVLNEAFVIYKETEEGTFKYPPLAVGNEIADDFVDKS